MYLHNCWEHREKVRLANVQLDGPPWGCSCPILCNWTISGVNGLWEVKLSQKGHITWCLTYPSEAYLNHLPPHARTLQKDVNAYLSFPQAPCTPLSHLKICLILHNLPFAVTIDSPRALPRLCTHPGTNNWFSSRTTWRHKMHRTWN